MSRGDLLNFPSTLQADVFACNVPFESAMSMELLCLHCLCNVTNVAPTRSTGPVLLSGHQPPSYEEKPASGGSSWEGT